MKSESATDGDALFRGFGVLILAFRVICRHRLFGRSADSDRRQLPISFSNHRPGGVERAFVGGAKCQAFGLSGLTPYTLPPICASDRIKPAVVRLAIRSVSAIAAKVAKTPAQMPPAAGPAPWKISQAYPVASPKNPRHRRWLHA